MTIQTKDRHSHIFFTHILIHIIIIVASPSTAIMLGIRTVFRYPDNLPTFIAIGLILALIINFIYFFQTYKKQYFIALTYDQVHDLFSAEYKKSYSLATYSITCPGKEINIHNKKVTHTITKEEHLTIEFYRNGKYIGEITQGGTYWNKEGGLLRLFLEQWEKYKT